MLAEEGAAPYRLLGVPYHPVSKHVHADYAALLNVGAAYLWIKPEYLHVVVCTLDMAVAETELEADMHPDIAN